MVRSIGNTPLVRLRRLEQHLGLPTSIEIHLKIEWVNPGGSIKDRTGLSIIRAALAAGDLGRDRILIDSTSGNTGIAYAMLGAALRIPVTLVVPESASEERKRTLTAYGANVVYSDPYEGSDGAIRLVRDLVASAERRYFYADQYNNEANVARALHHDRSRNMESVRGPADALRGSARHYGNHNGRRTVFP